MRIVIVGSHNSEGLAMKVAEMLGESDRKEFSALGGSDNIVERIQYGIDHGECYLLEDDRGNIVCLGGIQVDTGSIWLLSTERAEELNRVRRVKAIFALRGILKTLLAQHPNVIFKNVVSISNTAHIKLIKALGGKGFNTLVASSYTGSMFYPFYFQRSKQCAHQ